MKKGVKMIPVIDTNYFKVGMQVSVTYFSRHRTKKKVTFWGKIIEVSEHSFVLSAKSYEKHNLNASEIQAYDKFMDCFDKGIVVFAKYIFDGKVDVKEHA